MNLFDIVIIGIGLSMDAFAVATSDGIVERPTMKKALLIAFLFAIFQGFMPLLGYFCGNVFCGIIEKYDHWIALVLLTFIGSKMIGDYYGERNGKAKNEFVTFKLLIVQAIATSIDALAVGISFVGITFNIYLAVSVISVITFALCLLGVQIGKKFGSALSNKATLAGGIILIAIGLKIFLENIL